MSKECYCGQNLGRYKNEYWHCKNCGACAGDPNRDPEFMNEDEELCEDCCGGFELEGFYSEVNDEVKCCPDCEKPNQFGELCEVCRMEHQAAYDEKWGSSLEDPMMYEK